MQNERTKYPIFLDKKSDNLIVEALEYLQTSTNDKEKTKQIEDLLQGMFINRPYEWGKSTIPLTTQMKPTAQAIGENQTR